MNFYDSSYLQVLEFLPLDGKWEDPNDQRPYGVEDHPCGGREFLGHTHASEVEEGNADDVHWKEKPHIGTHRNIILKRVTYMTMRITCMTKVLDFMNVSDQIYLRRDLLDLNGLAHVCMIQNTV